MAGPFFFVFRRWLPMLDNDVVSTDPPARKPCVIYTLAATSADRDRLVTGYIFTKTTIGSNLYTYPLLGLLLHLGDGLLDGLRLLGLKLDGAVGVKEHI